MDRSAQGAQPQRAGRGAGGDAEHAGAGQPLLEAVVAERHAAQAGQPVDVGAHPHVPLAVLEGEVHDVGRQTHVGVPVLECGFAGPAKKQRRIGGADVQRPRRGGVNAVNAPAGDRARLQHRLPARGVLTVDAARAGAQPDTVTGGGDGAELVAGAGDVDRLAPAAALVPPQSLVAHDENRVPVRGQIVDELVAETGRSRLGPERPLRHPINPLVRADPDGAVAVFEQRAAARIAQRQVGDGRQPAVAHDHGAAGGGHPECARAVREEFLDPAAGQTVVGGVIVKPAAVVPGQAAPRAHPDVASVVLHHAGHLGLGQPVPQGLDIEGEHLRSRERQRASQQQQDESQTAGQSHGHGRPPRCVIELGTVIPPSGRMTRLQVVMASPL